MKTITYRFADGTKSEVEVTDEFYEIYLGLEREMKRTERKETRRRVSLEQLIETGQEPAAKAPNDTFEFENERLGIGYAMLLPEQRELLRRVFVERQTVTEIAQEDGVAGCSISKRLERIYAKLKKYLL